MSAGSVAASAGERGDILPPEAVASSNATVWVLSELYYPEDTSTGHFLTGIAEGLARGHRVRVLCAQPSYASRGVRAPWREERGGVAITRCRSTTFSRHLLPLRLVNMLTLGASVLGRALRDVRRGDVLLVVTNPPTLPFLALLAARLRGARCLLLVHDVYPEILIATGLIRRDGFAARLLTWLNTRLFRGVDRVIVLGEDMRSVIAERFGVASERMSIVPNWGDVDEVRPGDRATNPLLRELGVADRFVVQFSGNMGRTHGIDRLFEVVRELRHEAGIHFLFIGTGARHAWLRQRCEEERLENVHVLPYQPRARLSETLNACDVTLISFAPGMAGLSVPSRMYNNMAAGKPILAVADAGSELARVVREEAVGWVIPADSTPAQLVDTIVAARSAREERVAMGRRARAAAEQKYSREAVVRQYHELLEALG